MDIEEWTPTWMVQLSSSRMPMNMVVGRIAQLSIKNKRQEIFQTRDSHHCAVYAVKCTIEAIVLREVASATSVERKHIKKQHAGAIQMII